MNVVAYGGGTDSTAMIIECFKRNIQIDYILFADTGSEKPHTYEYVKRFSRWCVDNGLPGIITVKKGGKDETLEQECLRMKCLPSVAYGYKTCSQKYKIQPVDKFFNNLDAAKKIWNRDEKITKLIGYDLTEQHRAEKSLLKFNNPKNKKEELNYKKYSLFFPLIEWEITRKQCVEIIKNVGLCLPGKSACFFCPSSKVSEIKQLGINYPDLLDRALKMEANANLKKIKGLGHGFSWRNAVKTTDIFSDEFQLQPEMLCECFDCDKQPNLADLNTAKRI